MLLLNLFHNPIYIGALIVGLLIGITIHEFAHAWTADRCGDPTPRLSGRLSLNPFAHLDPIGTVLLFLVGIGWGKPVMINPRNFHQRKDELKVAIAGITVNFAFALILAIPLRIANFQHILIDSNPALQILDAMVYANLLLIAFNILPIPPLDGSHFIEYFLSEELKIQFSTIGQYLLIGLIVFGLLSGNSIIGNYLEFMIRFILSPLVKGTFSLVL